VVRALHGMSTSLGMNEPANNIHSADHQFRKMNCPHVAWPVARKVRLGARLEGASSEDIIGLDDAQLLLGIGDYLARRLLPS
jgi:hypothetical protein